jgi:hypothetical protein
MHYPSLAKRWRDHAELLRVQMTLWKQRGPDFESPGYYTKEDLQHAWTKKTPTDKNVEGLKHISPWP